MSKRDSKTQQSKDDKDDDDGDGESDFPATAESDTDDAPIVPEEDFHEHALPVEDDKDDKKDDEDKEEEDEKEEGVIEVEEEEFEIVNKDDSTVTKRYKIVPPEDRRTSERISNFECAAVLGLYAKHLDNGAPPAIDITNFTNTLEIAYETLMQRKIPLCVMRKIGRRQVEIWEVREMTLCKLPPLDWFVSALR